MELADCLTVVFAGTPLTEEDSHALEKLFLDKKIKGFDSNCEKTYETVVHHLRELGHEELADNLRANLDKGGYGIHVVSKSCICAGIQ